jgi:hypothetical protein
MVSVQTEASILKARAGRAGPGLHMLQAHCEQISAARPKDDDVGALHQAMAEIAYGDGQMAACLGHLRGRADWARTRFGAGAPETMTALDELGDRADEDFNWPIAILAWEQMIASELPQSAGAAERRLFCNALRHLGIRQLTDDPAEARALFARELAMREALMGVAHPEVRASIGNLTMAEEALGHSEEAAALRQRLSAS